MFLKPFTAEATALEIGLQVVWERGFRDVVCSVDRRDLIQALQDDDNHQFLPILGEIRQLLQRNWVVSLNGISREYNEPTDWLPKRGASSPAILWCLLEEPPWELEVLILRDRLSFL